MIRIILFLAVDRARGGGRGLGGRPDRRCRAVLGRLARRRPRCRCSRWRSASSSSRRCMVWTILRALWRTPARIRRAPARAAPCARPPRHHPRPACDRPWRFRRRPRACRRRAAPCRARSAGAAAARAIRAARWRPRGRAARLPRHGRARGHAAARPARPVHRGAARRRSGRGRDDRRRGAETFAVIDLGLACRARLPLRQGRLERRADDPRQQSRRPA